MPLNIKKARVHHTARWVTIADPVSEGEAEVLIHPWENPAFRRLQMQLNQEYRRPAPGRKHIKGQNIPPEIIDEMQRRLVVETILCDWRGIVSDDEGTVLPYSKENATALLEVEELRWIFNEIVAAAMNEATFRAEVEKEDTENLSLASPGNSHTAIMPSGSNN